MEQKEKGLGRRKFLGWLSVLSVAAAAGSSFFFGKKRQVKTIKMLTQDGQLVEVDASLIKSTGKKVSGKELQDWVKRN
jgi:hypothetical protein